MVGFGGFGNGYFRNRRFHRINVVFASEFGAYVCGDSIDAVFGIWLKPKNLAQ
ncbi:hypothetical protein [Bifidobacterium bombi]|uniref:hypothetical protein n=1 Tax=Bifidobacterium bombi TaxID=471511 RepID=UPI0012E0A9E9|nr:hypothetical protein [Bifidobacterium bombi]